MLRPKLGRSNPALLLVEIVAVFSTCFILYSAFFTSHHSASLPCLISLDFWLVLGVLAANFVTVLTNAPAVSPADTVRPPG